MSTERAGGGVSKCQWPEDAAKEEVINRNTMDGQSRRQRLEEGEG